MCVCVCNAHTSDVAGGCSEVVLSPTQDSFFQSHMYANFGDLGAAVKGMLEEFSSERKTHENISSIGTDSGAVARGERCVCTDAVRERSYYVRGCDPCVGLARAEDMQRFVASYPAFRQKNNIVSKHVAIVSELARLVEKQSA